MLLQPRAMLAIHPSFSLRGFCLAALLLWECGAVGARPVGSVAAPGAGSGAAVPAALTANAGATGSATAPSTYGKAAATAATGTEITAAPSVLAPPQQVGSVAVTPNSATIKFKLVGGMTYRAFCTTVTSISQFKWAFTSTLATLRLTQLKPGTTVS